MPLMINGKALLCGVAALALASCAGGDGRGPASPSSANRMVEDGPAKIGAPYTVKGVTYTPVDDAGYDAVGQAGWYGEEHEGNTTANGEIFNRGWISAAHPTLPLPSYVEVTALETGRTILVRVNDRGPFDGRVIDLSFGAAAQLGIVVQGKADVRVRRVNPPEQDRAKLRAGQAAAARFDAPDPLLSALRKKLAEQRGTSARSAWDAEEQAIAGGQPSPPLPSEIKNPGSSTPVPGKSAPGKATSNSPKSNTPEKQDFRPKPLLTLDLPPSSAGDEAPSIKPIVQPKDTATDKIAKAPAPRPATPKPAVAPKAPVAAKPPIAAKITGKSYSVQVAAFSSQERAAATAKRLGGTVSRSGALWRVRTGPYADRASANRGVERAASSGFKGAQIVVSD